MRLFVSLLLISTANLVACYWDEVKFLPTLLQPDLDIIERYYDKIDKKIQAFIDWPNDIAFNVQSEQVNDKDYLKINGVFRVQTIQLLTGPFNALYYKNDKFYVMGTDDTNLDQILDAAEVYYEQPPMEKGDSYLSVQYKSIEEMQQAIQQFYSNNENFLKTHSEKSPSTYLATWTEPTQHFLEYTTVGKNPTQADGGLLTLVGKVDNNKVSVFGGRRSTRLVFDPNTQEITIPVDSLKATPPFVENVFGVRMDSIGFLAEVRGNEVKMLSEDDLDEGAVDSPSKHTIYGMNLLHKSSRIEPKKGSCESADEECLSLQPKEVKFQVQGHVLVKKVNYLEGGETINEKCPYVIANESISANFVFGSATTKQICTDDKKLWLEDSNTFFSDMDVITLLYPLNLSFSIGTAPSE